MSKELMYWLREHCTDIRGDTAADLIEAQAKEIEVLKIAHRAHEDSNLKLLAKMKQQAFAEKELRAALVVAVDALDNAIKLFDSEILNEYDGTDMLDDRLADIDAERQALTRCKEVLK